MQFFLVLSTLLAATISTVLAFPTRRADFNNTRIVQLRLFGVPGCLELNEGELGIYGDALNQCLTWSDVTVQSVSFEGGVTGYGVQIFNDDTCTSTPYNVTTPQCLDDASGLASYKLVAV
ncbi:uncharacterized protein BP01DRAFT_382233 [Aspergillus saccharolyticus JOP 1030-1]|uniref:Uncharacterized protein n=1 Tax=Aspergillus saccharolyticus JOP 1030-1 TaxID=1450539 RepID=A0A319A192_9EURO|nr:hypothetical protein BP01DRAFT_382233 [Aspergillus saccharolyticus JOP 1030-1]PYH46058.1 hypothetical protein BP01DRAFT_382233 [Aspergillus saccharolyticus JOP 1030-1]